MTIREIKDQIAFKTQAKIQQMKQRDILLPEKLVDRCELCDQLSQEIYDNAVLTLLQIVDRNHLPYDPEVLLNSLHEEFMRLSNGAIEVLFARRVRGGELTDGLNNTIANRKRHSSATTDVDQTSNPTICNPDADRGQNKSVWEGVLIALKPLRLLTAWFRGWPKLVLATRSKVISNPV